MLTLSCWGCCANLRLPPGTLQRLEIDENVLQPSNLPGAQDVDLERCVKDWEPARKDRFSTAILLMKRAVDHRRLDEGLAASL